MRLDPIFRWFVYVCFGCLLVTGVAWYQIDDVKALTGIDSLTSIVQTIHGGASMAALLALGALIPMHMMRAWRARRNRFSGTVMALAQTCLVLTAFGLYYAGSDALRAPVLLAHFWTGVAIAVGFVWHVWYGRHQRRSIERAKRQPSRRTDVAADAVAGG